MAFLGLFGNYDKPGPGVSKDDPPKAAPVRFFQIFGRKFTKLVQANLIFMIPTTLIAALMWLLYVSVPHLVFHISANGEVVRSVDVFAMYVVPAPLILLAPFVAGLTFISRNFAREEHAFIWSDFWSTVKDNWKYFLLDGLVVFLSYVLLSFAMIYYHTQAASNSLFYIPFWVCIVIALVLLFAHYYLPMILITFDLKFGQAFKNSLIFTAAGFGRNLLITLILGALVIVIVGVIPIMPLTVMLLLLLFVCLFFSFVSFLINFTVYPVIDRYMIKPYEKKLEEEKYGVPEKEEKSPLEEQYSEIFEEAPADDEEDEGETKEKYVFINGKLVKESELNQAERDQLEGNS